MFSGWESISLILRNIYGYRYRSPTNHAPVPANIGYRDRHQSLVGFAAWNNPHMGNFRERRFLLSLMNTGMGRPPVVVGLFVAMMFWRSGPLGEMQLI